MTRDSKREREKRQQKRKESESERTVCGAATFCRVTNWSLCLSELPGLAFSRTEKQIWPFLKLVGFKIFENLLSSWPLFNSIKVSIVKSKTFSFLKTKFGIFQPRSCFLSLTPPPPPPCCKRDDYRRQMGPPVVLAAEMDDDDAMSWALSVFLKFFNIKK